jgi:hypothetical protein
MAPSFGFHPTSVFLAPASWTQSLHTERGAHLRLKAKMVRHAGQFIVPGVGDISSVPIELFFVRGAHNWDVPEAPPGHIGYLAYHREDHSDEFGHSPGFLSGRCSLPETIYDDLWSRLATMNNQSSSVTIEVGPTDFDGFEDTLWDRETHKFLFITDAEFIFIREERDLTGS